MPPPAQIKVSQMTLANGSNVIPYSKGTFIVNDNIGINIEFSSFITTGKVIINGLKIVGSNSDIREIYISSIERSLIGNCVVTAQIGTKFSYIHTNGDTPVILVL